MNSAGQKTRHELNGQRLHAPCKHLRETNYYKYLVIIGISKAEKESLVKQKPLP